MKDLCRLKSQTLTRRQLMAGTGAAAALAALPSLPAFAQSGAITAVMPGVFLPEDVRPLIEELSDTKVENAPYVSPTDTLAKLLAPGGTSLYDMMISTTNFVKGPVMGPGAGDEMVQPLDLSMIPNASKVMDLFKQDIITRDGKTYLLPVVWGYDSVIYNADEIPPGDPLTQSWGVLFDDKYAGKVAWRDDAHQTITVAALHLGIEEPAQMDSAEIAEVGKFLTSKKENVRTLWSTFGTATNLLSSGEVWALYGWIPMRAALKAQGMNVTNNWPTDGLVVWSQSAFIPKDSRNVEAAHRVINAFLDTSFGTALAESTNYPTTSDEIAESFSPEDRARIGLDLEERGVKTYPMAFPAEMEMWIETWNAVKAA